MGIDALDHSNGIRWETKVIHDFEKLLVVDGVEGIGEVDIEELSRSKSEASSRQWTRRCNWSCRDVLLLDRKPSWALPMMWFFSVKSVRTTVTKPVHSL